MRVVWVNPSIPSSGIFEVLIPFSIILMVLYAVISIFSYVSVHPEIMNQ